MATLNLSLTDHFKNFIEAGVDSGRFADATEMVLEGLQLLEQRELGKTQKLEWLRAAAAEGFGALERGDFASLTSATEMDDFFAAVHQEASAEFANQ